MSDYYRTETIEEPHRHRSHRHRHRAEPETSYRQSTYVERTASPPRSTRQMALIRREDSEESVEEIPRDFPPSAGYSARDRYRPEARRRASSLGRDRAYGASDGGYSGYIDPRSSEGALIDSRGGRATDRDSKPRRGRSLSRKREAAAAAVGAGVLVGGKELWDRRDGGKHRTRSKSRVAQAALGVAGAVAGDLAARQWAARQEREGGGSRRASKYETVGPDGYPISDYEDDKPKLSRRKSITQVAERAVAALGLGGALKELRGGGGGSHHDRDDRDYRGSHRGRRGSSSDSGYSRRSRSVGRDTSKRMQQAAQAALTAAAAEAWRVRKEPGGYFQGEKAKRILTAAAGAGGIDALIDKDPDRHEGSNIGKGAIGGMLLNRFVNGSREDDFGSGSRRARSYSRNRSRSRGGGSSNILKDLGVAGLAAGAAKKFLDSRKQAKSRERRYSSSSDSRSPPRPRRSRSVNAYIDRGFKKMGLGEADAARRAREEEKYGGGRGGSGRDAGASRDLTQPRGGAVATGGRRGSVSSSSSSEFSLEDEERNRRKMRGKEMLTAGLASIATVHAAHGVYQSFEARDKRRKAVLEGKMSAAEARKKKSAATAKDAFAIGIAALGVQGAVAEWKEMTAQQKEYKELKQKIDRHRRKTLVRQQSGYGSTDRWRHSAPNLNEPAYGGGGGGSGPVYQDGNPYATRDSRDDRRRR
ncbi:MAG: hypothetical protein M1825_004253 [Sarcosagium campestre]|nr:MAG: hypothetical protein M1825_004253 [Sarcosagium campestre]